LDLKGYISFLEKLGQKIYWIDDIPFSASRPFFYWSLPRFAIYHLSHKKARRLMWNRALGVIYPTDEGMNRLIRFCVCQGHDYDMKSLQSRTRTKTRRGLEKCKIRQVDWDLMRVKGLDINIEALKRQQRRSGRLDDFHWWDRQCRISAQFPDVHAWGAFVEGSLTAYVHVIIHDGILIKGKLERVANIAHFMSDSMYLKHYPNEALIYTVIKELLGTLNCAVVILGNTSDDPRLVSWKRHMGFQEESVPCRLLANPILHLSKHFFPKLKTYLNK
jgi:hypothetical protein